MQLLPTMPGKKDLRDLPYHPDDYCVWPDGFYATRDDIDNRGAGAGSSDDYEIVAADNYARLAELGLPELCN